MVIMHVEEAIACDWSGKDVTIDLFQRMRDVFAHE